MNQDEWLTTTQAMELIASIVGCVPERPVAMRWMRIGKTVREERTYRGHPLGAGLALWNREDVVKLANSKVGYKARPTGKDRKHRPSTIQIVAVAGELCQPPKVDEAAVLKICGGQEGIVRTLKGLQTWEGTPGEWYAWIEGVPGEIKLYKRDLKLLVEAYGPMTRDLEGKEVRVAVYAGEIRVVPPSFHFPVHNIQMIEGGTP